MANFLVLIADNIESAVKWSGNLNEIVWRTGFEINMDKTNFISMVGQTRSAITSIFDTKIELAGMTKPAKSKE